MRGFRIQITCILSVALTSPIYGQSSPSDHFEKGMAYRQQGNFALSISPFDEVISRNPNDLDARMWRADSMVRLGAMDRAKNDFDAIAAAANANSSHLNTVAWFYATIGDKRYRDGTKAVKYAFRASELTGHKRAIYLDTLAAAYAETGDFQRAIKVQEMALKLEPANPELLDHYRVFRAGRAIENGFPNQAPVRVTNTTAIPVKLHLTSYGADDFYTGAERATWSVGPNSSILPALRGKTLEASKIVFTFETKYGITPNDAPKNFWKFAYLSGQNLEVRITNSHLANPRPQPVVVAKANVSDDEYDIEAMAERADKILEGFFDGIEKAGDTLEKVEKAKKQWDDLSGNNAPTRYGGKRWGGIRVKIQSVKVASRKANGDNWDGVGKPDLRVKLKRTRFMGGSGQTSRSDDSLSATFNETVLGVAKDEELEISVVDVDTTGDDVVGRATIKVDAETIRRGIRNISFGQVESLVLVFTE